MASWNEIAAEIAARDHFLICAHERPDGDAVGSTLGLWSFLRACGKHVSFHLAADLPVKFRSLLPAEAEDDAPENLILLDCANSRRIAGLPPDADRMTRFNIDHHVGNDVTADFHFIDPTAPATSGLCAELALAMGKTIPSASATFWMLGLLTDTGAFRFSNTSPRAFRLAATLLESGAEYEKLVNLVYFNKPRNQQQFEAELLSTQVRSVCGGRFVYAVIPDELMKKYDFSMRDGEGLIDLLREIAGSVVAGLLYRKGDDVKISLRSKDEAYPVLDVAQSLGGGGHRMAAGITLPNRAPEAAAELLEKKIAELLNGNHNKL